MEIHYDKIENKPVRQLNYRRLGIAWMVGNVFMMPLFHY